MDFEQLALNLQKTHEYLQNRAVSAVNQSLTIRNWLYGYYIVEYEQNGQDKSKYGDKLLTALARYLKNKGMQGLSQRNLHYYRQFYLVYPDIGQILLKTE